MNNSNNLFIFASDPHGLGPKWTNKVNKMKTKYPTATIVFGGDYIDGSPYSKETVQFVMEKVNNNEAIALMGNHESLFLNALNAIDNYSYELQLWLMNGGLSTLLSFVPEVENMNDSLEAIRILKDKFHKEIDFIRNLPTMITVDNLLFVHAGLDLDKEDPILETTEEDKLWIRKPYIYDDTLINFHKNPLKYAIITGHTPTTFIKHYEPLDEYKNYEYQEFLGINSSNPIKRIQFYNEMPRYFTDGGCHGNNFNTGNILCIDGNGNFVDVM